LIAVLKSERGNGVVVFCGRMIYRKKAIISRGGAIIETMKDLLKRKCQVELPGTGVSTT
jgi:hypothetical protein